MKLLFRHLIHMQDTILPEVQFRDARLSDVFEFLQLALRGCPQCNPEHPVFRLEDGVPADEITINFNARYVSVDYVIKVVCEQSGLEMVFDGQNFVLCDSESIHADPLIKPVRAEFYMTHRGDLENLIRQLDYLYETRIPDSDFQDVTLGEMIAFLNTASEKHGQYDSQPPVYFRQDLLLWARDFGDNFRYNPETGKYKLDKDDGANTFYLGSPLRTNIITHGCTLYDLLEKICHAFYLSMVFDGRMCLLMNRQHATAASLLLEGYHFRVYVK